MDRNKEDLEELNKIATTTPITPTTTTATTHNLTTIDDDTSTESSDTFETWTLVNDKENKLKKEILQDNGNRLEILKATENEDEEEEETDLELKETGIQQQDSPLDDFSDGISIISESESVGRISPHPYLRDHLQDMNLKFSLSEHMDDIVLNKLREDMENEVSTPLIIKENLDSQQQQLRKRRKSSQEALNTSGEVQALQKASQTVAVSTELTPLVKRGLQGIFYVGVALGILALIGKIVHPTWQPLSPGSSSSSEELQQKVNDMELQNNLMRAEIDLLNKQVKYLSSLNDPQQQQKQSKFKDYKEGKTFKVWPGNGDTLQPVDITKQDLRKPYKCPDGSFVEIAKMCVEKRHPHDPSIVEQFGQVVEDMKQQSEAFKTFEKLAEELQGFQDNPFEQLQEVFAEQQAEPTQGKNNRPIYQTPPPEFKDLPSREKYQNSYTKGEQDSYKFSKYEKPQSKYEENSKPHKEYKKTYDQDDNNKEFKKHPKSENFLDNSKEWKTDKFNSKEKKYRKNTDFNDSNENSKENFSKERFNKQKRKNDKNNSHEHDGNNSGEWQEKYMKHREQQRKQNDQKYQETNKNWYIKRGDSREKKRSSEKYFR